MNTVRSPENGIDQKQASISVLEASQVEAFPYTIQAFGMEIEVSRDVFSPKHFHGWETFTRHFPSVRNEDVLEVGCGTGITAVHLARNGAHRVVAVDINPEAVDNTRRNAARNGAKNVEARVSDVFSGLQEDEKFHTIYWNLPFIFVPCDYVYRSMLERGLFDPGYRYTERFLADARRHLHRGGRLIVGLADFADLERFTQLAGRYRYTIRLLAGERSTEINPVEFQLYELRQQTKVFYAMPFTGRSHAEIVAFRRQLHQLAEERNLDLLEQFIGVEEEDKYESHGYLPLYIARKDHDLLRQADVVLVDYSDHSIGRDCELVVAKEVMGKRVIAIVPGEHMRNHPYIRLYSNYLVESTEQAFDLARGLSRYPLPDTVDGMSRLQKDRIDAQIQHEVTAHTWAAVAGVIPTELIRRWLLLFGPDRDAVLDWSFRPVPKTVRINSLRTDRTAFEAVCHRYGWQVTPVPSLPGVYRLPPSESPPRFGATPEYAQGLFYVQDLASLLPARVLDPQPGETVLDLGAAPGSKTTQMAEMMRNQGRIVAVDVSRDRMDVLTATAERLGITIIEGRVADAARLDEDYRGRFDRVLIDGPCSCEGIFRYKPHKLFEWDLLQIYGLTKTLEGMLQRGFEALKPGGVLVYSTCTYAPEENEAIVDALLRYCPEANIERIELQGIKSRSGLTAWEHQVYDERLRHAVRIYPQDNDSIGFFLAKITKKSE